MAITIKGTTNTTVGSQVDLTLTCPEWWSKSQEFAYMRLTDTVSCTADLQETGQLLEFYNIRARRIAATYARFYLETEERGDLSKKGRYYWMALGAFAAKTVAGLLEDFKSPAKTQAQVQVRSDLASEARNVTGIAAYVLKNPIAKVSFAGMSIAANDMAAITKSVNAFAKGNLWLFMDIAPWHWMYSLNAKEWNKCKDQRDACNYPVPQVAQAMKILPWNGQVLPVINCLKVTEPLLRGFEALEKTEKAIDKTTRQAAQLEHLLAIAEHEQKEILQKTAWADQDLITTSQLLRGRYSWFSPQAKIVFTSKLDTTDERLQSIAPSDMQVEVYASRFRWIEKVAATFHKAMTTPETCVIIERELTVIAGWVDAKDPT